VLAGGQSLIPLLNFRLARPSLLVDLNRVPELAYVREHERGLAVDYLRIRALPLSKAVVDFVAEHEHVYIVEQNRDGQMYDLVRLLLPPELVGRVRSIRHYDGQPIPAYVITRPLLELEAVPV